MLPNLLPQSLLLKCTHQCRQCRQHWSAQLSVWQTSSLFLFRLAWWECVLNGEGAICPCSVISWLPDFQYPSPIRILKVDVHADFLDAYAVAFRGSSTLLTLFVLLSLGRRFCCDILISFLNNMKQQCPYLSGFRTSSFSIRFSYSV